MIDFGIWATPLAVPGLAVNWSVGRRKKMECFGLQRIKVAGVVGNKGLSKVSHHTLDCGSGLPVRRRGGCQAKLNNVVGKHSETYPISCFVFFLFRVEFGGMCELSRELYLSVWNTSDERKPLFQHHLKGRPLTEPIRLVTFVETAVGLLNFKEVCDEVHDLAPKTGLHHDGVVFGSDDFCASIGATRTKDARELLYARQKVVVTCKAFGLQAIDLVYIDYKDVDGLRRQAREGALMGFTGKQVIHPGQIAAVQEEFSPSPEKVQWASQLISAFEQHQKEGKGAFTFGGSMIDMPSLKQAQNIITMSAAVSGK
uniref:HpcH/HpaI aldolase/citrate lyase domain-containing protein n=1 Tax=Periophthalmus magnuspinnatus TaxID=409849 RepID=A0A3B4AWE2_9GOBI